MGVYISWPERFTLRFALHSCQSTQQVEDEIRRAISPHPRERSPA